METASLSSLYLIMKYEIHVEVDEDGIAFIYDRTLDTNEMLGFMPLDKAQAIAEEVLKVTKSK